MGNISDFVQKTRIYKNPLDFSDILCIMTNGSTIAETERYL